MVIERTNIPNITATIDQQKMANRFDSMLNKVCNMIETQGPIYTTWIKFQIGLEKPIVFDSSSTDMTKNLIASLTMEKQGAGVANKLTLTINYDPFNHGQNTTGIVEKLDDLIAKAMSYDMGTDNKDLRGTVQYGYNYTQDQEMISPKYQFVLTQARSKVQWSSGLTTYTFEGVSELAQDSDYTGDFEAVQDWGAIDLVNWILYYYYGDSSNPPSHIDKGTGTHAGAELYKYRVSIPESLFETQPKISMSKVESMSPWIYCQQVLQNAGMSQKDQESGKYENLSELPVGQRPRYTMYMIEKDGVNTIYINYTSPKDDSSNIKIPFDFTWNTRSKNIVQEWDPGVDLRLYLIQKAKNMRAEKEGIINKSTNSNNNAAATTLKTDYKGNGGIGNAIASVMNNANAAVNSMVAEAMKTGFTGTEKEDIADEVFEMYDTTLTLVGIPADAPLGAIITVTPKILESTSRTAGKYMIKSCIDNISTNGIFTSQLNLLRTGSK